jgi:orotate phosphoribosyltransferase
MSRTNLVTFLSDIAAVKFGNFRLSNGQQTPFYLELDPIISFPHILNEVAKGFWELVQDIPADRLCGVPYTAVPIATCLAQQYNIPMLLHRKSSRTISGSFNPGQTCLVIEDIIHTGHSVLETINDLQQAGLMVKDIVTFLDREQGGRELLAEHGYHLHTLFTLSEFINLLKESGKIEPKLLYSAA